MDNDDGLYRESSCTIVKFLYHLANLRHYKNGYLKSVVQERYKKTSKNDYLRTLYKRHTKKKRRSL